MTTQDLSKPMVTDPTPIDAVVFSEAVSDGLAAPMGNRLEFCDAITKEREKLIIENHSRLPACHFTMNCYAGDGSVIVHGAELVRLRDALTKQIEAFQEPQPTA